eukprot:TRINITY_DN2319_c0_g1_i1.p1 TRINITY_DN2319_c0_g1~~TRINITY_DN2319_c0_g1_i1.p1  ORF type:complete len:306 (+),score=111.67 TRINITY_DN2319_c0_g1_i1:112-1029(+)
MQDESLYSANNMQAELHDAAQKLEDITWPIFPGSQILRWRKVVPNFLTILAVLVGLSSIYFGMEKKFHVSVWCILTAGLLDGLDGPAARLLKGTSRFGAELDSLSDYVNFGVAPGIVLYFWSGNQLGFIGWIICLIYVICMGCRLARFNAGVDFNASPATRNFFMGIPAPAGGALVLSPIIASFQFGDSFLLNGKNVRFDSPYLTLSIALIVGLLLVSRIPTYSSKMIHRRIFGKIGFFKILLFVGAAIGILSFIVAKTWLFALGFYTFYVASFPFSFWHFKRRVAKQRILRKEAALEKEKSKDK